MKKEITFPDALTYPMAKLLIKENHEICPCCGSVALIATDSQRFECPKEDKRWKSIFPIDDTKIEPEPMWPKENPSIKNEVINK